MLPSLPAPLRKTLEDAHLLVVNYEQQLAFLHSLLTAATGVKHVQMVASTQHQVAQLTSRCAHAYYNAKM
jgi:hypothetical protein